MPRILTYLKRLIFMEFSLFTGCLYEEFPINSIAIKIISMMKRCYARCLMNDDEMGLKGECPIENKIKNT